MARINIDDSLFKDRRFQKLIIEVNDPDLALGLIVRCFCVAQKHWLKTAGIPKDAWKKEGLSDKIIEVGLATIKENLIYVHGSEEQFAWLNQKSNAGSSISEKKLKQLEIARSKRWLDDSERTLNDSERNINGSEAPSLSLSLSPSQTHTQSQKKETTFKAPKTKTSALSLKTEGSLSFDCYAAAYRNKYKTDPVRNKKINAQFKYFAERLGSDAPEVAGFYLTHNDFTYTKSMHAVDLLLRDAEKLHTEWATGNRMTNSKAKSAETVDHYREQIEMVNRGEL